MKRRIIVAMEEYEGTDPNDLDFSDFEPVMGTGEGDQIIDGFDSTVDSIDMLDTHTEITDIIATEGLGNRPQIAAIALSALETRLFGQPVTVPRVGTESRTRIATEGKNILARAWDAIVKFLSKIGKWFKELFSGDKKKKVKKKKEEIKSAIDNINKDSSGKPKSTTDVEKDIKVYQGIDSLSIPPSVLIGIVNYGSSGSLEAGRLLSPDKTGKALQGLRSFFFKEIDIRKISEIVKTTSDAVLDAAKKKNYSEVGSRINELNELMDFTKMPNYTMPGLTGIRFETGKLHSESMVEKYKNEMDAMNKDPSTKAAFLALMFSDKSNGEIMDPLCDEIIKRAPDEKALEALIEETKNAADKNSKAIYSKLHPDKVGSDAASLLGTYKSAIANILTVLSVYSKYIIAEYNMVDALHQLAKKVEKIKNDSGKK